MHRFSYALAVCTLISTFPPAVAQDAPPLDTIEAQMAYTLGQRMADNVATNGFDDIDIDALFAGFTDRLSSAEPRLTNDQMRDAMVAFQEEATRRQEAAQAAQFKDKIAANAAFLAENSTRAGVTTTESGLQYIVTEEGTGASPTAAQTVVVHYAGRLLDGTEFDSSYSRGAPATFGVTQVIPGWTEALQLMKPGAKWEVWLPSDIAYGPRGAGASIGPHEVLNFTIELIEVQE